MPRQKMPATLRNSVWNYYIGSEKKTGKCYCCKTETISTANFECGHIIAKKNGGELTLSNLRPICSLCNKSMGTQNMETFMEKHGFCLAAGAKILEVEFDDPFKRNYGEKRAKKLLAGSKLYNFINKLKDMLRGNGFPHADRMALHTEVLNDETEIENTKEFLTRVQSLEGRKVDVINPENYKIVGRSIALILGSLKGYKKQAKITIAFFDDDKTDDAFKFLIQNIELFKTIMT